MLGILGPFGMISRGNLVLTHVARAGARWCVLDIQEMEDLRKDREFFQWEKRDGKHHLSHSFPSFSIVFHHVPQFNQNNRDFETKTRSFMVPIAGSKRAKHGFCKTRWFQSMSGKNGHGVCSIVSLFDPPWFAEADCYKLHLSVAIIDDGHVEIARPHGWMAGHVGLDGN